MMPPHSVFVLLMFGLLVLTRSVDAGQPEAGPLHPGELFPTISGITLSGRLLELPAAASGKPAVVIFSFSRTAGKDAHLWNEHLARGFSNAVPGYELIVMESVPKLFRGMAMSGIRSSMPPSMQDRTVVLYQDEKLWKRRLAVSDNNRAYVVLLGPDGHLRWSNSGAYTDSEYARLNCCSGYTHNARSGSSSSSTSIVGVRH
jgi:ATP10 protein